MPTWVLSIFNMLLGGAVALMKAMGPPPIVVEAERTGAATQEVVTAQQDAAANMAMADAAVAGPKTQADVINRLKDGPV